MRFNSEYEFYEFLETAIFNRKHRDYATSPFAGAIISFYSSGLALALTGGLEDKPLDDWSLDWGILTCAGIALATFLILNSFWKIRERTRFQISERIREAQKSPEQTHKFEKIRRVLEELDY